MGRSGYLYWYTCLAIYHIVWLFLRPHHALSQYSESDAERKRLLEEVLTLKGSVRVFCRVRPPVGEEMSKADGHRLFTFPGTSKDCTAVQISEPPAPGVDGRLRPSKTTEFGFNRCARDACAPVHVLYVPNCITEL